LVIISESSEEDFSEGSDSEDRVEEDSEDRVEDGRLEESSNSGSIS